MNFRKDINGLRAIAVLAVVIFHFYPSLLTGGFAGVDVFFVISGFLMTGIIFRGLNKNNFSILEFYISRANRIIPPLAILCLALLIFGYFFTTTWDYKTVGRDVSTSMLFISNFMFSMRGGYFDTTDNFLLHTWSLSVEWQFYIIYPVLIVLFNKFFSIKNIKRIIILLFFSSFVFSVFATKYWPTESYFLLPTRAWEMLLGGLAYLYPIRINNEKIYKNSKSIELIGVFLIVGSYFTFSEKTEWPGYLAFIPTIGAWLIIQAYREKSYLTGNFLFQNIGLWSYSIYLWHWPIAVSYNYFGINEKYKIIGILLSILLGYLSFTLIEKRKFKSVSLIKPIIFYTTLSIVFVSIGVTLFITQGLAKRENLAGNPLIQGGTGNNYIVNEGISLYNTKKDYDYILIGDSNSNHYTRGILNKGSKVKSAWYATCLSFPNSINIRSGHYVDWKEKCTNNYKNGLEENKKVIIAQSWVRSEIKSLECVTDKCNLTGNYYKDLEVQVKELIESYPNKNEIYILGELPKPKDKTGLICLRSEMLTGIKQHCNSIYEPSEKSMKVNNILNQIASDYGNVNYIDLTSIFCNGKVCNYELNGKPLFMTDGGHLSGYGSEVVWNYIINKIEID